MSDKKRERLIYQVMNDMKEDFSEIWDETEEIPADDLERERVKREMRRRIEMEQGKKKKVAGMRAAAIALAAVVGMGGFCAVNPSYAKELPLIGDVFRLFDNRDGGLYSNYKENAVEVGETLEDNGFRVTLNDAVYDGKSLALTYTLETDRDLGESFYLGDDLDTNLKESFGMSGYSAVKKVSPGLYAGQVVRSFDFEQGTKRPDQDLEFKWTIREIGMQKADGASGEDRFDCRMKFAGTVPQLARKTTEIGESVKTPDGSLQLDIERISFTRANFTIEYGVTMPGEKPKYYPDQPGRMSDRRGDIVIQVTDDLGNVYDSQGNGGFSTKGEETLHSSTTFQKLAEGATKLIVQGYDFINDEAVPALDSVTIDVSGLVPEE